MASKQSEAEIKKLNEELERQVIERTRELVATNEALKREIMERQQAEKALREIAENMATAQRIAHFGSWEIELTAELEFVSPQLWSDECYRILGFEPGSVEITEEFFYNCIHPDDREFAAQALQKIIQEHAEGAYEYRLVWPDGSIRYVYDQVKVILDEASGRPIKIVGTVHDITERKQLEAENEQLSAQFYQAQKMESIGRLAGGIAHDFNNLLVSIIGYAELSLGQLDPDSQLYADLERIKAAGERAASLTRQILAFSRQQVLEMKMLDLNQVIREFEPMLHRLIGEDIALQIRLAQNLPFLKADKGQLEQVLLNLVVNARDAMPHGGRLVIETSQVVLDEVYTAKHPEARPGPHLLLAVSDTGYGMDAATQQRIFEPFFTTKAQGQGTGLGLSTVFGIVKQHRGSIWVYSEPGLGTSFKIYLPLADAPVLAVEPERPEASSLDGTETVLLIEDEVSVRQLVGDILRAHGYQVLEAGEPEKGLALAAAHEGPIHLLLTDVIMPQMNGRSLYQQLVAKRGEVKVLYMSGYTDNVTVYHSGPDGETAFLQKPFTIYGLLRKVRRILG